MVGTGRDCSFAFAFFHYIANKFLDFGLVVQLLRFLKFHQILFLLFTFPTFFIFIFQLRFSLGDAQMLLMANARIHISSLAIFFSLISP
jgi:competence protein ComGF